MLPVSSLEELTNISLVADLLKKKVELASDYAQKMTEIDNEISDLTNGQFKFTGKESVVSKPSYYRKGPKKNAHTLEWYLILALYGQEGDVGENIILQNILEMGYQSKSASFQNIVYTRLTKLQKEGLVKKGDIKHFWKLTNEGKKVGKRNMEEKNKEMEVGCQ